MSQPYPPQYPSQQPSPYPQQSWSDPRTAIPEQTHLGSWAPQPAAPAYPAPAYPAPQHGGHPQPPYGAPGPQGPPPNNTMGMTAIVLAVVGLLLSWIPFVGLLSVLLGLLAVVFGLVGWNRARQGRAGLALPVAGAAIGIVAIVVGVLSTTLVARLIPTAPDSTGAQPAVTDTSPAPQAPAAGQAPAADGTLPAPGTYTWDDGLSVQVSAPTAAEFSETACCPGGDGTGVAFEVTVVNGTPEVIEPYVLFATLTADGRTADQVFDTESGYDAVTASVPPGRQLTVTMAFDAPGGDLLLEFTSFDRDSAFFSATL